MGPAAALVLAYLLVLQSIAFGVSTNARGAALFSGQICVSKASGPLGGDPATPARPARHGDKCCVFHCAGFGAATATPSPFIGEPPILGHVDIRLAYDDTRVVFEAATPPLGSRAPPIIV